VEPEGCSFQLTEVPDPEQPRLYRVQLLDGGGDVIVEIDIY